MESQQARGIKMSGKTLFVLVAVTGVEDEVAAEAAIQNLSNADQDFWVTTTKEYDDDLLEQAGDPVIYLP
jgi:hypothetical protein